jgi:hypothetical protein
MKKTHKKNFLMMLLLAVTLISCGGDDDDGDDSPQRDTDTTGSSGTTGSTGSTGSSGTTGTSGSSGTTGTSGTSGTTGGTTASCMTNRQRENIRLFLNRASDLRTFHGTGTETIRESDVVEDNNIAGTFDFVQSGENTWIVNAAQCTVAPSPICQESQTVIAFRNGCLNVNGVRAKIISASDSSLTYSILENGTVRDRASLASGKLEFDETIRRDGETVYKLNFEED